MESYPHRSTQCDWCGPAFVRRSDVPFSANSELLAGRDDMLGSIGHDFYGGNIPIPVGTCCPALGGSILKLLKIPDPIPLYIVNRYPAGPDAVEPDFIFAQR